MSEPSPAGPLPSDGKGAPETNQNLEEFLFEAALAKSSPEGRAAFLDGVCRDNPELRARLEVLLEGHFQAEGFLSDGSKEVMEQLVPASAEEGASASIGRYKLLEKIGEGGFGEVWMADQKEPVKRRVALKIIKLGMDTRQVVARFEAERQALALMDHPNIAKVLDGGATDTGRPYFVMELVRGIRITDYCYQNQLPISERLKLFVQVCRAIQHAHQKGIIHRDIKPSNILVTLNDGLPVPKVIDFGIAKATQMELTEKTVFTQFHQFLGTPAYVSPEQASMNNLDVDTRSDIYSLGVLLYELLTGTTPFDTQELLRAGLEGMRQIICERQPLRPSTRLNRKLAAAPADSSTQSKIKNQKPKIADDLDWIVMKCLEKERARRYETASGLARDIERHLNHEPVVARPPSRLYEFQNSVRRHWVGFIAVGSVLAALGIGAVVGTVEAVRARGAEQRALRSGASEATARATAEERLYAAKLSEARAKRLSGRAGQRIESLAAISEAAAIHRSRELSDDAAAALALTDLRVQRSFQLPSREAEHAEFDDRVELCASETEGGINVRPATNNQPALFIPVRGASARDPSLWRFGFDRSRRYLRACFVRGDDSGHWRVWDLSQGGALVFDANVASLSFAPDGRTIAVAREDGIVSVEDLASSQELRRLNVGARLFEPYFSPDGSRIAGFTDENPILRVWEVATGEVVMNQESAEGICALAWNHDGTQLATGGRFGTINLWDAQRGELRLRLEGHQSRVTCVAFDHQGSLLASTGWDGTTRLWDISTGQPLVAYTTRANGLNFSPDDQILAGAVEGTRLHLLQVVRPAGYRRLPPREKRWGPFELDISPDGHLAAVASRSGIWLVDILAGQELGLVLPESSSSVCFESSPTPSLWSSSASGLDCWPLRLGKEGGEPLLRVGPPERRRTKGGLRSFAFDREAKRAALVRGERDGIVLWDRSSPPDSLRFCPHSRVGSVALDPAGQWAATGTWLGDGVKVWDFASGKLVRELPVSGSAAVASSPDGKWLATVNATAYRLWDTRSWLPAPEVVSSDPKYSAGPMAFSPDGRLLATSYDAEHIQIVMVPTFRPFARILIPFGTKIEALRFSPNAISLAALQAEGTIHLWDLRLIRSELQKLNLDWEMPPFPTIGDQPPTNVSALVLDAGPFSRKELAEAIPARDTNALGNLIDLTRYYNAPLTASWESPAEHNDFSELPCGLQTFAGVRFDVRGLIQIGNTAANGLPYPSHVLGIPIGRACQRLHFLHAAAAAARAQKGDELGSYIVHYVDGGQVEIPLVVGKDLGDWWTQANETNVTFVVAWTGINPSVRNFHRTIRLFRTTWENPRPSVPIRQFDFILHENATGAPFLVAVTAEQ